MLEAELNAIFEKQEAWVKQAETNGNYTGDVINSVHAAIHSCRNAVGRLSPQTDRESYIAALLAALDKSHDDFRREQEDEYGYGSSTFHEIKRDVAALAGLDGASAAS